MITGASGRKVFTAAQTGDIFKNLNKARAMMDDMEAGQSSMSVVGFAPQMMQAMAAAQKAKSQSLGDLDETDDGPPPPLPSPSILTGDGGGVTIIINSHPVFHMGNGTDKADIEAALKRYMETLKQEIYQELESAQADKARRVYD